MNQLLYKVHICILNNVQFMASACCRFPVISFPNFFFVQNWHKKWHHTSHFALPPLLCNECKHLLGNSPRYYGSTHAYCEDNNSVQCFNQDSFWTFVKKTLKNFETGSSCPRFPFLSEISRFKHSKGSCSTFDTFKHPKQSSIAAYKNVHEILGRSLGESVRGVYIPTC